MKDGNLPGGKMVIVAQGRLVRKLLLFLEIRVDGGKDHKKSPKLTLLPV